MKKIFNLFLLIYTFTLTPLFSDEVLARVDGESISKKDVNEFVVKSIPGATFNALTSVQKKAVLNQMIDRKLFLEDAKRSNIEKNTEYQQALKKMQENLMLDYWMKAKVEEIVISEDEAKKYYFKNSEKFSKPASVKVRHILLPSNGEALKLIAQLSKSSQLKNKFIELAHAKSTGPSAVNGGELDWFVYEQMVPEFSEAAFALKVGSITKKAVKTQFGYHIIYLEDKKEQGSMAYEMVKEDIVKVLRLSKFKMKLAKLSKKLKKTANIIVE
ncbi:MAG: Peptidyl-prolyl cis-trans isomerase PpiC [uncultured Sulfurovum sp.]|uniref:Peptidyl-prolyl cis-trans isomerase PpiC n=1 Tax=uncultured Sulfurovum sp. TaxID=269237 RepID=A0A6S6U4T5_9BACT|nr:MAG: Peptidyl-prolyl cis-trans isomerase PpiC [uncultured Sulfurovum sp.]